MKHPTYTRPFCTERCPRRENPEATCYFCRGLASHDRFFAFWSRLGWNAWQYSGAREICALINPNWKKATEPKASTFLLWFVGVYIALFGLASQLYENRLDQIENRANGIYAQLGASNAKRALERIPRAQGMTRPRQPEFWPPWPWRGMYSVVYSLVGPRERDEINVQALTETIVTFKEDLKGVNLNGVTLKGADLSGANLEGATLEKADLSEANLYRANFHGVNLHEANLHGATPMEANLRGANLSGANFTKAVLARAVLQTPLLFGANFTRANLTGTDLSGLYLNGATLTGANLTGANLTRSDLSGLDLSGLDLTWATLTGANLSGTYLDGAILTGATLSNADLLGTNPSSPSNRWMNSFNALFKAKSAQLPDNWADDLKDRIKTYFPNSSELPDHLEAFINAKPSELPDHFETFFKANRRLTTPAFWNDKTEWPEDFIPPCSVSTPDDPCLDLAT